MNSTEKVDGKVKNLKKPRLKNDSKIHSPNYRTPTKYQDEEEGARERNNNKKKKDILNYWEKKSKKTRKSKKSKNGKK